MKISPIMNSLYVKNSQPTQQQNVKGLWGEYEFDIFDTSEYHFEDTREHYYPFKDETKQEIQSVVDKYSSSGYDTPTPQNIPSPVTTGRSTTVWVHDAIPFTKKEFAQYLDKSLSAVRRFSFENYMKKNNLHIR